MIIGNHKEDDGFFSLQSRYKMVSSKKSPSVGPTEFHGPRKKPECLVALRRNLGVRSGFGPMQFLMY